MDRLEYRTVLGLPRSILLHQRYPHRDHNSSPVVAPLPDSERSRRALRPPLHLTHRDVCGERIAVHHHSFRLYHRLCGQQPGTERIVANAGSSAG